MFWALLDALKALLELKMLVVFVFFVKHTASSEILYLSHLEYVNSAKWLEKWCSFYVNPCVKIV